MITLTRLRTLNLSAPSAPGRPLHLSAASGLAAVGPWLYVVADDELHLGCFPAEGEAPGALVRLFEGDLPDEKKARKKLKPDLEALAQLPRSDLHPHGALLAFGSGSKKNRRMGALLHLDAQGGLHGHARAVDLSTMLAPLDEALSGLNIEGAVATRHELLLFQRGNGKSAINAIVHYPLRALLEALDGDQPLLPSKIVPVDLGDLDGIPLGFTDATLLPDGELLFTAAAEDTDNAYDDGPCAGAAVGVIDSDGAVRLTHRFRDNCKVEGVHARRDGNVVHLLLVTDADDPETPASLYGAQLEL